MFFSFPGDGEGEGEAAAVGSEMDGEAGPEVDVFFLGEKKEGIGREEAQGDITAVPRESEPHPLQSSATVVPHSHFCCGFPVSRPFEVWWASANAKTSTFLG